MKDRRITSGKHCLPPALVLAVVMVCCCAAIGCSSNKTRKDDDFTVANLNLLHGLMCPGPSSQCRLTDRVELLFKWIEGTGCPDVITLQEIWDNSAAMVEGYLATSCPFEYELVYQPTLGIDEELILSRYPVIDTDQLELLEGFRHVLYARIDHPMGPVDVFTTHLASGSDGGGDPCESPDCPAECVAASAGTKRQCQVVQMVDFVNLRHVGSEYAVVTGDFNLSPNTFGYMHMMTAGFLDGHVMGGNPECDPGTGIGCTSGRLDEELTDLESDALGQDERIDYIWVKMPMTAPCSFDTAVDIDSDGVITGLFAGQPNPFESACGPAPLPICWPSDHSGVQLDLNCPR